MTGNEERYILSGEEIKILLAGLGYETVIGFFSDEEDKKPEYSKIINIIVNLINKNIICFENEKMHIDATLTKLLCSIGDNRYSFSVEFPVSSKKISCYSLDEDVVICEPMVYQNDRYILTTRSKKDFLQELYAHESLSELQKTDENISEVNLWEDKLNTVLVIEMFKNLKHYAVINVRSHAFGSSEITVRYADCNEEKTAYSEQNLTFLFSRFWSYE